MKPATFGEIVPPLSPRELTFDAAGQNVQWADFLAAFEVGHLALRHGGGTEYAIISRYAVKNLRDEEATTFFAAHTEYWKHPPALKGAPIVIDTLYQDLIA